MEMDGKDLAEEANTDGALFEDGVFFKDRAEEANKDGAFFEDGAFLKDLAEEGQLRRVPPSWRSELGLADQLVEDNDTAERVVA